jgi:hypothetical protein
VKIAFQTLLKQYPMLTETPLSSQLSSVVQSPFWVPPRHGGLQLLAVNIATVNMISGNAGHLNDSQK